jgi:hypothetical protein
MGTKRTGLVNKANSAARRIFLRRGLLFQKGWPFLRRERLFLLSLQRCGVHEKQIVPKVDVNAPGGGPRLALMG